MDLLFIYISACLLAIIFYLGYKLSSLKSNIKELDKEKQQLSSTLNDLHQTNVQLTDTNEQLAERNQKLEVYSSALDADKEAAERLEKAKAEASDIVSSAQERADNMINSAQQESSGMITEAEENAKNIIQQANLDLESAKNETSEIRKSNRELIQKSKEDAERIKSDATRQAALMLEQAEEKAKTIAGDAYEIAQKAQHYENVAKAMKNVIEGYGDEYLKPTFSLLDDLAEEFGYDEAGQRLKDAREKTKMLIKSGNASKCDYVETNRRTTAENFVLDAFNGKVDSILSMIKKDNHGILEQKIRDAYSLVNNLGMAFRNAHITEVYLEARLDELKWGAVVNELKLQEREEQRRIKEQIREEEKARREYERAMKEAAKEEDTIRRAMEKAQQAIEKASAEQKAKYEAQLADLQVKLQEAEAKNQRALSMAQQTKSGHVYIISNIGSFGENVFKIGMTRRLEPLDRVRELGDASVPFPFDVHAMIYSEDAPGLETALHKYFVQNQVNKVNPRKEFFRIPIAEIKAEVEKRGLDVTWTMVAAALEYRESLAIEKSMLSDGNMKDKWIQQQNDALDNGIDNDDETEN
uniref:Helicase n=1 Tax=Siphoviridae sp. ctWlk2 TaxID=2825539 RepID=A0A8S5U6N5_9CAUD|nr:MAG TPA: helicase [Siphoviridae sp. ctWlk2]